jgi:hypothetical protein
VEYLNAVGSVGFGFIVVDFIIGVPFAKLAMTRNVRVVVR